jgi:hypothetical protein
MKKTMAILVLRLIGLASLAFTSVGIAMAQSPVNVGVYAEHYGGKLVYYYRVVNNSPDKINVVRIGYDSKNDNDNYNDVWELLETPSGWSFDTGIPPASATSPPGWRVYVITLEESELLGVNWATIDNNSPELLPGQTLTGMSVTLDKADTNYLTSHADIHFSSKHQYPTTLTVPIERLDTTPPSLTVSLSPNTLWSPNDKLVSITAAITVKDDYDPSPEIKLESITANKTLEAEDIRNASFGTDDRSFKLRAERKGKDSDHKKKDDAHTKSGRVTKHPGRIYTVTYSATDASGNKSTASATVTVPHDQDEKEKTEGRNKGKQDR